MEVSTAKQLHVLCCPESALVFELGPLGISALAESYFRRMRGRARDLFWESEFLISLEIWFNKIRRLSSETSPHGLPAKGSRALGSGSRPPS